MRQTPCRLTTFAGRPFFCSARGLLALLAPLLLLAAAAASAADLTDSPFKVRPQQYAGANAAPGRPQTRPTPATSPVAVVADDQRQTQEYNVSSPASLSAALTTIKGAPATVVVSAPVAAAGLTIPSNVTLRRTGTGQLTGTGTVNVLGDIDAGRQQFFAPMLTVSLAGNTKLGALLPEWWGATGDGATDDSAALQRAIAAAVTRRTGKLKLAAATYLVNGAVRSAVARLLLPNVLTTQQWVSLEIEGEAITPQPVSATAVPLAVMTSGTILKSTATGAGAVLGCVGPGGPASFTAVTLTVRNLTVRTYDNPQQSGIDASQCAIYLQENVLIDTGVKTFDVTQPTTATAYGLKTPANSNAAVTLLRGSNVVQGYYTGVQLSEHATVEGQLFLGANRYALEIPFTNYPIHIDRLLTMRNTVAIRATGNAKLNIAQWAIEHSSPAIGPAWQHTVYDVDDSGDLLGGRVNWFSFDQATNAEDSPRLNGANRLVKRGIREDVEPHHVRLYRSTPQAIPTGVNTAISFDTEVADYPDWHSNSANPTRITIKKAGVYTITGTVDFEPHAAGTRALLLLVNGATVLPGGTQNQSPSPTTIARLSVTAVVYLAYGNYVELYASHSRGAPLSVTPANNFTPSLSLVRH